MSCVVPTVHRGGWMWMNEKSGLEPLFSCLLHANWVDQVMSPIASHAIVRYVGLTAAVICRLSPCSTYLECAWPTTI